MPWSIDGYLNENKMQIVRIHATNFVYTFIVMAGVGARYFWSDNMQREWVRTSHWRKMGGFFCEKHGNGIVLEIYRRPTYYIHLERLPCQDY